MLIVYDGSEPQGISPEYVSEHGLTPPTLNIVAKRQARQEIAREKNDGDALEGIDYWEMVEIQIAALMNKDKPPKPICHLEVLEEPDVDPVLLEKILISKGRHDLRGYSGQDLTDAQLELLPEELEGLAVPIPDEILAEFSVRESPGSGAEEEEILSAVELLPEGSEDAIVSGDEESGSSSEEGEETNESESSDEEDDPKAILHDIRQQKDILISAMRSKRREMEMAPNEFSKSKLAVALEKLEQQLADVEKREAELLAQS
jgi:TATA-binding protein-associated factor Taf7